MKVLLQLKSEYKSLAGKDWKPGAASGTTPKKQEQVASTPTKQEIESSEPPQAAGMDSFPDIGPLMEKIDIQGNKVRDLKAAKAPKVGKLL